VDEQQFDRTMAVALASGADQQLTVVAKGYGVVAELIVERARAHGLYVHASPELVELLVRLDLDQRIPPKLYSAVGEILAWLHERDAAYAADGAD
jgi:flagellar biosynthesis protein